MMRSEGIFSDAINCIHTLKVYHTTQSADMGKRLYIPDAITYIHSLKVYGTTQNADMGKKNHDNIVIQGGGKKMCLALRWLTCMPT